MGNRRNELHDTKRFWCTCERCQNGVEDLSRGFICPKCREGTIFAFTPPAGPQKDGELRANEIVKAKCPACGNVISKKEAQRLAGEEKKLADIGKDYAEKAEDEDEDPVSANELQETEKFVDSIFGQHVLADLALEQLADSYGRLRRTGEQRRILQRRCVFQEKAYPGLNGSHAWTMEALGDAMLRASKQTAQPSTRKRGKGAGTAGAWQPVAKEEPKEAFRLYEEARRILLQM